MTRRPLGKHVCRQHFFLLPAALLPAQLGRWKVRTCLLDPRSHCLASAPSLSRDDARATLCTAMTVCTITLHLTCGLAASLVCSVSRLPLSLVTVWLLTIRMPWKKLNARASPCHLHHLKAIQHHR